MSATVHLNDPYTEEDDFSINNGEEFLTVAKDKNTGMYMLFQPDREQYEFVSLAEKHIQEIESDQVEENHNFKVWGEKDAWGNTPSPVFDF